MEVTIWRQIEEANLKEWTWPREPSHLQLNFHISSGSGVATDSSLPTTTFGNHISFCVLVCWRYSQVWITHTKARPWRNLSGLLKIRLVHHRFRFLRTWDYSAPSSRLNLMRSEGLCSATSSFLTAGSLLKYRLERSCQSSDSPFHLAGELSSAPALCSPPRVPLAVSRCLLEKDRLPRLTYASIPTVRPGARHQRGEAQPWSRQSTRQAPPFTSWMRGHVHPHEESPCARTDWAKHTLASLLQQHLTTTAKPGIETSRNRMGESRE